MQKKAEFSSRIGLIAATAGSAIGLGNIWRFPAEAQANGGAAFLFIYALCVLLLGIPVMLGEFSLGRAGKSDAVGSLKNVGAPRAWWSIGALGVIASYLILCYYMVVAGWTLEYLWASISGSLFPDADVANSPDASGWYSAKMSDFITSSNRPLLFTILMIFLNLGILIAGVQKGIERLSNVLMPLLFVILLILVIVSLSLPKASEGLAFFFSPDFSKVTPQIILGALGQAFFSLSLGMGVLITYASYFPKDTNLTRTAFTISLLDMFVAIMMGVIIFPAVTSFNLTGEAMEGTALVFVTLPEIFAQLPATQLWSTLFFLLLAVAALTSTISVAEVSVAFIRDRFDIKRLPACLIVMLPLLLLSSVCSMSLASGSKLTIGGNSIFDVLDNNVTNVLLPVGSILLCIYIGWIAPKSLLKGQLTNEGKLHGRLIPVILFIIRFIAPLLIGWILVSYFLR